MSRQAQAETTKLAPLPSVAIKLWWVIVLSALPGFAAHPCVNCHLEQVEGYLKTGMAQSLGRPEGRASGQTRHGLSGSQMKIFSGPLGMWHHLDRAGLSAEYLIDYFVGSGNQGRSYLINIDGYLFQSPISYYTEEAKWDVSPGYHAERELDFDRPILAECLFCHSGRARSIPSTLNRYESPPLEAEAITCERCHGPSDRHLVNPSAGTVVNPAKLPPSRRDAVCEQCHLGGEARILNPGRQFWDYQPGDPLEDVFSVYTFALPEKPAASHALKVVSHSEQLAASQCASRSGDSLWCGTCHDPHDKPDDPAAYYRERCRQCHSSGSLAGHAEGGGNCIACHMPRRPTYDGAHTAFTDHLIRRRPPGDDAPLRSRTLRPWREPPAQFGRRNLGLAHISVGERDHSAEHLNEGFRLLAETESMFAGDTAVLTSLGVVLQRKNVPGEAAKAFLRAAELEPRDARHYLNLGVASRAAGDEKVAIESAQKAISLDPSLLDSYLLLAEIYQAAGQPDQRRETLKRYLQFMPQSVIVRDLLRER